MRVKLFGFVEVFGGWVVFCFMCFILGWGEVVFQGERSREVEDCVCYKDALYLQCCFLLCFRGGWFAQVLYIVCRGFQILRALTQEFVVGKMAVIFSFFIFVWVVGFLGRGFQFIFFWGLRFIFVGSCKVFLVVRSSRVEVVLLGIVRDEYTGYRMFWGEGGGIWNSRFFEYCFVVLIEMRFVQFYGYFLFSFFVQFG